MTDFVVIEDPAGVVLVTEESAGTVIVTELASTVVVQETSDADLVEVVAVGPQGASGSITVGTVTTGAGGTSAAVVNVGTPTAAVFDFTIPRGEVGDVTPEAAAARDAAIAAQNAASASQTAAADSASSAGTSATQAATSASSAQIAAATATTKAADAASSASSASSSASSASGSASTASTKASEASTSAANAATSASTASAQASAAATSATNAAASASTATTKASDATSFAAAASSSASSASSSATSAANSASTATTQAGIATSAASSATSAASNASSSSTLAQDWATKTSGEVVTGQGYGAKKYANDAASSASSASTSASNASTSASSAATQASNAAGSATAASGSATAAATSATSATSSATSALTSANTATAKASEAATSATNAANSATAAAASATSAASASAGSVHFDIAQSLTSGQKSQAASNLGLAAVALSGAYSDLTGKPTAVSSFTNDANYLTSSSLSGYLTSASAASTYQPILVSGTTIKTINGTSLLGSGDVTITAGVSSFNTRTGAITLSSGDVTGALGFTPENPANKNAANGYAGLDSSGLIPSSILPSYVDDVLEYANQAGFPGAGVAGKIYVAIDTNKIYRWSGSVYIEITSSPGSTDAVTEGSTNLYFTTARARGAVSASGSISYNSTTGVLSYTAPTALSSFTNDSGFITSSALSPYLTSSTADSTYAPLASPTLTGTPAAPTAAVDTNTTQLATTAYVVGQGYLKSSTAASTYQTTAGMSSYLTTSSAASLYQPLDGDLTSIAGLVGTSGILKKTAANIWALDTTAYLSSISTAVDTANSGNGLAYASGTLTIAKLLSNIAGLTGTGFIRRDTGGAASLDTNTYLTTASAASTYQTQAGMSSYLTTASAASTYAPLASPSLTGTPLAPTAAADTSTTQIATTEFVIGQGYLKSSTAASTYQTTASAASTYLPLAGGTLTGDLTFSGSNRRIIGDFTSTSRVLVQTSSANSNTVFGLIPNGTSVNSQFHVWGASDITNAPIGAFTINSAQVQIQSTAAGTGTILPFRLLIGQSEVFRATTGLNFLVGTSTDDGTNKVQVLGGIAAQGSANNLILAGSATTAATTLTATGTDSNVSINIVPKGTGTVKVNGVDVDTVSGTATLTNKRVTKRSSTTTSSATPTINTDNVDIYGLTAQAVDITSFTTNLSGTPTDGQLLWIYIIGTAARAIAWGTSFESSTATLPTTTVSTNRLDVGFAWNAASSKWRCVAVA